MIDFIIIISVIAMFSAYVYNTIIQPMVITDSVSENDPVDVKFSAKLAFVYRILFLGPLGMMISRRMKLINTWILLSLIFTLTCLIFSEYIFINKVNIFVFFLAAFFPSNVICSVLESIEIWRETFVSENEKKIARFSLFFGIAMSAVIIIMMVVFL